MEKRKFQFLGFVVILLGVGILNYFRKISLGFNLSKVGKVLFLVTMVTFTISVMFVLYFTDLNNILSFAIGLAISVLSEHIAKLFIVIGNHFNSIVIKVVKRISGIDLTDELTEDDANDKHTN